MTQTKDAYSPNPHQYIVAKEGFPFISIAFAMAFFSLFFHVPLLSFFLFGIGIFIVSFFRNPTRHLPGNSNHLISPADGKVIGIFPGEKHPLSTETFTRISIFMSVFNAHVNRFPTDVKIKKIVYHTGKFLVASDQRAATENESNQMLVEDEQGQEIVLVQIAGLVARRIICYFKAGASAKRGEHLGLIRFGSRVDLYLPQNYTVSTKAGDKLKAGLSIIGERL
ncbi:MAG: phosphatidylserine decarboxylase family protein [Deltaproteobacteria bacterium CG_4_10_14_0_2_um_filter_43_8]|nr:MAG: phosphatidylserine decarboxylase family protein [Deltaproteobacteria bacterium CG11_big_fil_rev_8_21_14_0_20_42_23]PJA18728.1 MAG: phosphatidylserine decarboxylase family protein [Deltaproteobacteria bacterium CG_4_10_14_0_2_um_filter_43_8]PJC64394.1 MAG: phosphatidylserine decarboxylase family protein [Deltaproteobacteria bacterium CG_4_9_14_0_2_um_filter_42_21]